MKRTKILLPLLLLLLATFAMGQATIYPGGAHVSVNAATAGTTGTAFALVPRTYSYTWTVTTSGTVTAATLNLEGSLDNSTWFPLDVAASTDSTWSSGECRHIAFKPVNFLRVRAVTVTGGGSVTAAIAIFN